MSRKLKSTKSTKLIYEVIEMTCQGFTPEKSFCFQGEIYEVQLVNSSQTSWLYYPKDGTTYIEFRYDTDGFLKFVELQWLESDDDGLLLYDPNWTSEQKKEAFYEIPLF